MLRPSSLILLIATVVSCSGSPNPTFTLPTSTPTVYLTWTSVLPIFTAVPTASSTPAATTAPPIAGSTRIIILNATVPAFVTSSTPSIAHTPTSLARIGWRTYVVANLNLAVDYPPDWTVTVQGTEVIFASPENAAIQLTPIDPRAIMPNDEIVQPNTRCTNLTNPHGVNMRTCLATIGFSLDAYLDLKPGLAATISTRSRGAFDVFNALIESARMVR